jgi:molecular chaperone HscB
MLKMSAGVVNLSESNPRNAFKDYFDFFQLPRQFKIDRTKLDQAYLKIQQEVHPDRHAQGSDAQKRQSLQLATFANTAHQTLKQAIPRGFYLCELAGLDAQLETNTAMPRAFLMQQMEWREAMDEARNQLEPLNLLQDEVNQALKELTNQVAAQIDQEQNLEKALESLRACLFLERFLEEIDHRISALI